MIKTAAVYVKDVPTSFLVPPIFSLLVAAFWIIWIFGFVYLYSFYDTIRKSDSSPFSTMTHT